MWKAAYYRKQAQVCLVRDEEKAAKYALAASRYLEQADRVMSENTMQAAQ